MKAVNYLKILAVEGCESSPIYLYLYYLSSKLSSTTWFSLTDSPYPAHVLGYAVDIYAPYPYMPAEEGTVSQILRIPTPKYRCDAITSDWVLIIDLGNDMVLKILHVKPQVRAGERVFLGDELGDYIISGFFLPWSERHMHVEVRPSKDPLKVRGAYKLVPTEELLSTLSNISCVTTNRFRITYVGRSYCLARPAEEGLICADVSGSRYVCDCGIPHYGYGAAVGKLRASNTSSAATVEILGHEVGVVELAEPYRIIFTPKSVLYVNNVPVRGLSTYLLRREVKIILSDRQQLNLSVGDEVTITFMYSDVFRINKTLRYLKKR